MKILQLFFIFYFFFMELPIAVAGDIDDVVAIIKLELYEHNADADPKFDAFKIFATLGDKSGFEVELKNTPFSYKCEIYDYSNKRQGRKISSDSGETQTYTYFGIPMIICNLPDINVRTRLLVHVKLKLPNGKILEAKDSDWFDPEKY